jgi:hypothetical protein
MTIPGSNMSHTQKTEAPQAIRDYVAMVSNLFERKPKIL